MGGMCSVCGPSHPIPHPPISLMARPVSRLRDPIDRGPTRPGAKLASFGVLFSRIWGRTRRTLPAIFARKSEALGSNGGLTIPVCTCSVTSTFHCHACLV